MFAFSVTCLIVGVGTAGASAHYPHRGATLERVAGCLILAGLIPIGAGLPLFR